VRVACGRPVWSSAAAPQRERTATSEGEMWARLARPCWRLRRADAAGRPPGAAATRFGREGYRSTPVTGLARDAQAGSTVAYARFPGREAVFRTVAEADASGTIREELAAAAAPRWRLGPIRYSSPARLTRYPARTAGPHRSHVSVIFGHLPVRGGVRVSSIWSVLCCLAGHPRRAGPLSCSGCRAAGWRAKAPSSTVGGGKDVHHASPPAQQPTQIGPAGPVPAVASPGEPWLRSPRCR
jgi:AcrR family transcriptional regulator